MNSLLVLSSVAVVLPAALNFGGEGDSDGEELFMSRATSVVLLMM